MDASKLPPWNVKIGKMFESLGVGVDILLVATAVFCIYAVFKWKSSAAKALLLAYLLSP